MMLTNRLAQAGHVVSLISDSYCHDRSRIFLHHAAFLSLNFQTGFDLSLLLPSTVLRPQGLPRWRRTQSNPSAGGRQAEAPAEQGPSELLSARLPCCVPMSFFFFVFRMVPLSCG